MTALRTFMPRTLGNENAHRCDRRLRGPPRSLQCCQRYGQPLDPLQMEFLAKYSHWRHLEGRASPSWMGHHKSMNGATARLLRAAKRNVSASHLAKLRAIARFEKALSRAQLAGSLVGLQILPSTYHLPSTIYHRIFDRVVAVSLIGKYDICTTDSGTRCSCSRDVLVSNIDLGLTLRLQPAPQCRHAKDQPKAPPLPTRWSCRLATPRFGANVLPFRRTRPILGRTIHRIVNRAPHGWRHD